MASNNSTFFILSSKANFLNSVKKPGLTRVPNGSVRPVFLRAFLYPGAAGACSGCISVVLSSAGNSPRRFFFFTGFVGNLVIFDDLVNK